MKKIEIESFSETTNAAVVRLPGRKFPGIVIQGDSLRALLDSANEIADLCRGSQIPQLEDCISELVSLLMGYSQAYEEVLREHNESLPYG